jgi:hypothetical protein
MHKSVKKKSKGYPCNRPSRLPRFLDNLLTDGGDVMQLHVYYLVLMHLHNSVLHAPMSSLHLRRDPSGFIRFKLQLYYIYQHCIEVPGNRSLVLLLVTLL